MISELDLLIFGFKYLNAAQYFDPIVKIRLIELITLLKKSLVPQRGNHQHVCIITHLLLNF